MCRVISESDEGGGGHSEEVGLKSVHRKIKRLFGKVDDEGELMQTTDDFDLDDDESESDENEEQEIEDEQQLYWEVRFSRRNCRLLSCCIEHYNMVWDPATSVLDRNSICPNQLNRNVDVSIALSSLQRLMVWSIIHCICFGGLVMLRSLRTVLCKSLSTLHSRKRRCQWATRRSGRGWRRCRERARSGARTLPLQWCCRCARGRCGWSCTRAPATAARVAPLRAPLSPWQPSSLRAPLRVRRTPVTSTTACFDWPCLGYISGSLMHASDAGTLCEAVSRANYCSWILGRSVVFLVQDEQAVRFTTLANSYKVSIIY